ncbi:hypothetical protein GLOIN_2v1784061 [Rhizophagus irregularis DAOM 181602=DAOM 197198]|uniref:Uncharacterized protein n=1 Tax=Rhizophagus irregularis (strain DAOM 181602 / DAOM 197198 / MUCL 43194) TaxID=747089 RepID=A0A2P4PDM9_RHIID|nr:hypothetical protein GLOIN_2v1784061 [Rhizophagus irregularis DAOM 181602=DAOM 197198]POG63485.1 hypothetical protein GLOIN_2v1784061 [Rhizophagus irregularis DAOM 181602=DAOM 197198]|eukprot:XP_025170351.1 hypothetical protein GLOIN_2v1784061 [Rhizophagus irregularis DAOM 181602=DAOM 197198]
MSLIQLQTYNPSSIIIRNKHKEYGALIDIFRLEKEIYFLLFDCNEIFANHPIIFNQLRKIINENRCGLNLLFSIHTLLLRLSRLSGYHDEKISKIIAILKIIIENTIKYCDPDDAFNTATSLPTHFINDIKDQIAQMDFSLHKDEIECLRLLKLNYGLFYIDRNLIPFRPIIEGGQLKVKRYNDQFVYELIQDELIKDNLLNSWDLFEQKFSICCGSDLLKLKQIGGRLSHVAMSDIKLIIPIFKVSYFGEFFVKHSEDKDQSEFLTREALVGGSLIIRDVKNLDLDKLKAQIVWAIKEASCSGRSLFNSAIVKNVEDLDGNPIHDMKDLNEHTAIIAYEKVIPANQIENPYNYFDIRLIPGITKFHKEITMKSWTHDSTELKVSILLNSKDYIDYICETTLKETQSQIPFLKLSKSRIYDLYLRNTFVNQCKIFHEKIVWEKQISKPSKNLIKDINDALDNAKPYESLIKVFSEYGHLIRTEVSFSRDLSYDEGPNQWSLSDKQKLIPLYDILDDDIKSRIQDLSTDKILMKGFTKFNTNKTYCYDVQFEEELKSDDYLVAGSVVVNDEKLKNLRAKFKYMSRSGFSIFLEDDEDSEEIKTDFDVVWQIIGKPKNVGYFGKDNRDIKVLSAQSRLIRLPKEKATYPIPPIYFKEELTPGTIIVTFIDYALHGGSILDVVVTSWSGKRIDLEIINHLVVDTSAKTKAHKEHEEIEMSGDDDEDKKDENEDDEEDMDEKKDEDEKDEEKKEDKEDNKDYKEDKNEDKEDKKEVQEDVQKDKKKDQENKKEVQEDKKEDQEDNKEEEEDKEEEEEYDEENGENFPYGFVRFFVLAYAIIPNKEDKFTAYNTEVFIRGEARQFSWKHVGHELGEETVTHITENIFEKRTSYLEYSKYIM